MFRFQVLRVSSDIRCRRRLWRRTPTHRIRLRPLAIPEHQHRRRVVIQPRQFRLEPPESQSMLWFNPECSGHRPHLALVATIADPGLTRKVLPVRRVRIIEARATNRLTGKRQPKPGLSPERKPIHNSGIISTPAGIHHALLITVDRLPAQTSRGRHLDLKQDSHPGVTLHLYTTNEKQKTRFVFHICRFLHHFWSFSFSYRLPYGISALMNRSMTQFSCSNYLFDRNPPSFQ